MITAIALLLILVFSFLSALHVYWGFGGRRGSAAVLPTKDDTRKVMMPGAVPTFTVALGLLCLGGVVFLNTFEIETGPAALIGLIRKYGLWAIATVFLLRAVGDFNYIGFFKKVKTTRFARNDTRYYSPLCLLIGLLAIVLEINK
ncbi:MAG: DUF3995 domain-containing protein [Leadbetterella sp.]|nr:DUF3995 domain-containing protein [Leadbetterella sp.]